MADYTNSKSREQKAFKPDALETSNLLKTVEPLLTPELLVSRYLKKVDLKDYNSDELKDYINRAVNESELLLKMNIFPVQYKERLPFDRALYKSFVFTKVNHGPVTSVDKWTIESSNGETIFSIPNSWVEMGNAHKRIINIVPILSVFGTSGLSDGQPSNAGLIFLNAVSNSNWIPAFFSITYTAGLCGDEGKIPMIVNEIVGMTATINLLSDLQTQYLYNSQSIGQDGISQSSSGPGNQVFLPRIQFLTEKRDNLIERIKGIFYNKIFMSNI